jgi:glucose/arabinose dehydrogenase
VPSYAGRILLGFVGWKALESAPKTMTGRVGSFIQGVAIVKLAAAWAVAAAAVLAIPALVSATVPATPTIVEPSADGQLVHPADVHMVASAFSDSDGDRHACSDWRILNGSTGEPVVWEANCATGTLAVHIHLGDGHFVGDYQGRTELEYDHDYVLQVRFRDSSGELSEWAERPFGTYPRSSPGGAVPWTPVQAGYRIDTVATHLQLPVNIAFVPHPGNRPRDPLLYITELYGTIKVIDRDGTVGIYATGLLNYDPTGNFPGSGEQGLTGIVVDPASGDVFASMVYDRDGSDATPDDHYPKVVRFHSTDGGHTAATKTPIIRMPHDPEGPSHQISNLTIGPDRKLYVHNGDGVDTASALDLSSFRGKILRMNLDGSAPSDNPFYDPSDGAKQATDYIYAYGFRNPFGGAWRAANGKHYEVEDGPHVDRFAKVQPGASYGWDGSDHSMRTKALYNWDPAHAPVNVAFIQPSTFLGSGFPTSQMDHAFVTESGSTYATGPQVYGKRIVEFDPRSDGELGGHPQGLVEYTGNGKATAVGLAAGPDGLYWTDLYKDLNYSSPIDPGARLLRVRYVGTWPNCTLHGHTLAVMLKAGRRAKIARLASGEIKVDGHECGATILDVDRIEVNGSARNDAATLDLARGRLAPGYSRKRGAEPGIPVSVDLGAGAHDALLVREGDAADRLMLRAGKLALSGERDVSMRGVERPKLDGGAGPDHLVVGAGFRGPTKLNGGRGGDKILGGRGRDIIAGGAGADAIVVRGGGRDKVSCGRGHDVLDTDHHDRVTPTCETGRLAVG